MFDDPSHEEYQYVTLEWQRMIATYPLPPGIHFERPYFKEWLSTAAHESVMAVEALVLGRNRPPHKVTESDVIFFNMPASPFQLFKKKHQDSWWMKWFIKKHPIIFTDYGRISTITVQWEMRDLYPHQTRVRYMGDPVVMIDQPNITNRNWGKWYSGPEE